MTSEDGHDARTRIVDASYDLFSRNGVKEVRDEDILKAADVPEAILREHFPERDDLIAEFLDEREMRWTIGLVESQARARGITPEARLLAIFDVFDDWFNSDGFEACSFINVMIEMGPRHPLGQASIRHLESIRTVVASLAAEADLREPAEFARAWHILMKGSIISATEGDKHAAKRAQSMAVQLIEQFRSDIETPA